ncbi:MAG: hypothetical protein WC346_21565, partial [Methanogenium sp.]
FNYKKDKEYLINQYLEDLFKAKKVKDFNKIKSIKERLDELISVGSKLSWVVEEDIYAEDYIRRKLKLLEDKNWKFEYDKSSGWSFLFNVDKGYTIFAPYDILRDEQGLKKEDERVENHWVVQYTDRTSDKYKYFTLLEEAFSFIQLLKTQLLSSQILSWKEPPFPPNKDIENKVFDNLRKDVEETNRFTDTYDAQQYEGILPLRLEEVISIKNQLKEVEIDYKGLEFTSFFAAKRNTFYGSVYDLIGVDDNGEYTILASGIASSYKEILEKTSSNKISWKNPPIEIGSIWRNIEEDKFYYIKEVTGEYAIVYELYNEENGIYLKDILSEYKCHSELKKPLVIFNHCLLVGGINNLLNSGVNKLSWKIMSDVYYDFEEWLRNNNIHFKTKDGIINIIHEGNVFLDSLQQLPDNVQFNNKGYVNLPSLTQLPDNVQFNNKGYVDLPSLTQLPDNVQFNNKGSVFLDSLTQLPDDVQFNNKGNVFLSSLTQLPDNKEQIFKNDGIVYYNGKEKYDLKIK